MWTFPPNYVCMKSQSHKAALCYVKVLTRIMKLWSMSFIWSLTWTVVFLPTILTLTFLNMFCGATHSIQNCVQNNNTHCNLTGLCVEEPWPSVPGVSSPSAPPSPNCITMSRSVLVNHQCSVVLHRFHNHGEGPF